MRSLHPRCFCPRPGLHATTSPRSRKCRLSRDSLTPLNGGFALFRWGLVPPWVNDPRIGNRLVSTRADTVTPASTIPMRPS